MNPNVKLESNSKNAYIESDAYYTSFDVVIVNNHARHLQLRIDDLCNKCNAANQRKIGFFSSKSVGTFGYLFANLQKYIYQTKAAKRSSEKASKEKKMNSNNNNSNSNSNSNNSNENKAEITDENEYRTKECEWSSLNDTYNAPKEQINKQLRHSLKKYRKVFYMWQVLEQTEDLIIESFLSKDSKNIQFDSSKIRDIMINIGNKENAYNKVSYLF